jgi:2-dehydropantoate 2-reductase
MRIAAMAAGAVGSYFGARLAAAGHDVFFVARGANLAAMRDKGLTIESVHGDMHLPQPNVTDDPATIGPVDIVLFAVKLWDTETAAAQARPLVGPGTRVITLQNGVDSPERVAPVLGADTTIGGVVHIASVIREPGIIAHTSDFARMRFGRADGKQDQMLSAFAAAAADAKLDVAIAADITVDRWQKFIFLTAMAGTTAGARSPIGPIIADPDGHALFRTLMAEAFAVGKAKGVALSPDYLDTTMRFVEEKTPKTMKASMAHDLDRGNRMELDWLTGRVSALGRELNVPTPASDTVFALLKPHRHGRR